MVVAVAINGAKGSRAQISSARGQAATQAAERLGTPALQLLLTR
jgi:hypothetical protein